MCLRPLQADLSSDADQALRASAAAAGLPPPSFPASGALSQELLSTVKEFMVALVWAASMADDSELARAKPDAGHDYALLQVGGMPSRSHSSDGRLSCF
jgi:hypothetical protein